MANDTRGTPIMDLGIAGRTAIVCASSKGLGRGCAEALAEAGCRVVINGRNAAALDTTAVALRATGAEIVAVAADIGTAAGRAAVLEAAGTVDILVNNNAGPPFRDYREIDRDAMIAGVEANMITPIELIKAVIDGMTERRFGRIVNITSSSVKAPISGLDLSSGARAGLTAFLAGVARMIADKNVTINNIMPGAFDTDRLRSGFERAAKLSGTTVEAAAEARAKGVPAKRFGTAEEFGALCAFLCSAQAGYITGQSILIDGGLVNTTL
jgi:3-oxoacyl-[acyl-carrier protein] reductase